MCVQEFSHDPLETHMHIHKHTEGHAVHNVMTLLFKYYILGTISYQHTESCVIHFNGCIVFHFIDVI